MQYLNNEEYEAIAALALKRYGLTQSQIQTLLAARWPMLGTGLISEAEGRGLIITRQDIEDWLREITGGKWSDGAPVTPENTFFSLPLAERFFEWCVKTKRAKPTLVNHLLEENPSYKKRILQLANSQSN